MDFKEVKKMKTEDKKKNHLMRHRGGFGNLHLKKTSKSKTKE